MVEDSRMSMMQCARKIQFVGKMESNKDHYKDIILSLTKDKF